MNYQRDNEGRFSNWKVAFRRFFRRLFWTVIFACILVAVIQASRVMWPNEVTVVVDRPVILDNLTGKINELKGELIADLRKCESNGYKEEDGLIIFDSNKVASIGLYQFQKNTVIHYYKTLYGKEIKGREAVEIALSEELSGQLASDIIFKLGKLSDWANCNKKVGLAQQLKVIETISK